MELSMERGKCLPFCGGVSPSFSRVGRYGEAILFMLAGK